MTTETKTTLTFEPVANATWVEVRAYPRGESPSPWIRTSITDLDAYLEAMPNEWDEDRDALGPITPHGKIRRTRFYTCAMGESSRFDVQELTRYGGVYEQVEELKRQVGALQFNDGPLAALACDFHKALEDILAHDRFERDALARDGHCRHGVYVGGCGVDWMCGPCEDGAE